MVSGMTGEARWGRRLGLKQVKVLLLKTLDLCSGSQANQAGSTHGGAMFDGQSTGQAAGCQQSLMVTEILMVINLGHLYLQQSAAKMVGCGIQIRSSVRSVTYPEAPS